jgi:glutamate-1-semialdehyde 2,1-aminomutase
MVSVKPKPEDQGDARRPTPVPASRGLLPELTRSAVIAPFNDIDAVESLVQDHANDLAGIIIEPVAMNMGYVLPKAGFLEGLRKLADEAGAILIFDEVKTCGKFYGGAEDAFGVAPDLKIFGKAIGGGIALAGVGGKETVMDEIVPGKIAHAGTFNANPLSVTAGLVTLTKILTPAGIRHAQRVGDALGKGYEDIVEDRKLDVVMQYKGISGAVHFTRGPVTDWRSFQHVDVGRWWAYATSMQNRGIIASAPGADEQWTTSVAHTKEDVRTHLEAFEEVVETVRRMRETVPLVEAV